MNTTFRRLHVFLVTLLILPIVQAQTACPDWLNHSLQQLHSDQMIDVCAKITDKPILLVNTASHCGFTSQFGDLEALYQRYRDRDLVVIGFPSNDFNQEATTAKETARICYLNFGVTFLMTEKISVAGEQAHPIFQYLASHVGEPSWNFNKFLVDRQGQVINRFSSWVGPESQSLSSAIEKLL
jgi:glutathione peroxidase